MITGPLATDTAIEPAAPVLPRLSVAFSAIVSGVSVLSVSLNVASAALTCASDPVMVRLKPPAETLPPCGAVADSAPCVSDKVTENVSPVVVPVSLRLTPAMVSGLPIPTVTAVGAAMTGRPFTVTPIVVGTGHIAEPIGGVDVDRVGAGRRLLIGQGCQRRVDLGERSADQQAVGTAAGHDRTAGDGGRQIAGSCRSRSPTDSRLSCRRSR